jgi:NADPH:quinone reductase-like Zn-dependent oxidoreductase
MEVYRIDRFGSVDGIVLRSSDDPRAGSREVLTRVRASPLNYRDLMVMKGGGRGPTKLGVVPLSDDAGEVAAIGDGVTRVKVSDRMQGHFIRAGLAALSGRNSSPTGSPTISTGCWRNCGVERRGARARAKPPLLRGGRDITFVLW